LCDVLDEFQGNFLAGFLSFLQTAVVDGFRDDPTALRQLVTCLGSPQLPGELAAKEKESSAPDAAAQPGARPPTLLESIAFLRELVALAHSLQTTAKHEFFLALVNVGVIPALTRLLVRRKFVTMLSSHSCAPQGHAATVPAVTSFCCRRHSHKCRVFPSGRCSQPRLP
jgi:hypothetical protein